MSLLVTNTKQQYKVGYIKHQNKLTCEIITNKHSMTLSKSDLKLKHKRGIDELVRHYNKNKKQPIHSFNRSQICIILLHNPIQQDLVLFMTY